MPLLAGLDDDEPTTGGDDAAMLDLSSLDVVLPSSRAVYRLRERLSLAAQTSGRDYRPPRFFLVGRLPSLLYRRPAAWASDFEQTLAWARVLAAANVEGLKTLVPTPPDPTDTTPWLELAATTRRLWTTISAENWTFARVLKQTEAGGEERRWQFLTGLYHQYLVELAAAECCDPNAAALDAIDDKRCRAIRPIVLVGASDLPEMVKTMLAQNDTEVTALIAAPESLADCFDAFGCLISAQWREHVLPLRDEQLVPAAAMEDQSRGVIEALAEFGETLSVDAITIGVTDESQIDSIENQCRLLNVPTYRHLGWSVAETSVGRLLELLVTFRSRRHWRSLAALVRHAAVFAHVDTHFNPATKPSISKKQSEKAGKTRVDWLTRLDQLMSEAFPRSVDHALPAARDETLIANEVLSCVQQWLAPLDKRKRTIRQWSQSLAKVLQTIYPPASLDSKTQTSRAVTATLEALAEFEKISVPLDTPLESLAALELLSTRINEIPLADTPAAHKIEILGWLDLALDDAPALVVCGLNHPFVPEAASSDPFLPSTLQQSLSQRINDRRYARDVHAMQQMLSTRQDVRFLIGTHSADGSPTPPSRLLAAASADDAARRVCELLTSNRPRIEVLSQYQSNAPEKRGPAVDYFGPPTPQPGRTVDVLSVTAFSAYLACPYRFYLRHVLRLRPLDDASLELAANQFGDLVHGALEFFGQSKDKDESDPKKIEAHLIAALHRYAAERYGENTVSTVQLQVRQAERRLKTVAQRQAERIADGWRIHAVEASVDELDHDRKTNKPKRPTGILLDGVFTGLRGRFDRIDYHPEQDRWAILDYKTHGHLPEKKHLKQKPNGSTQWIDLQLPLYRRFIPDLNIPADPPAVELGYFNVAEKDTETKINIARFTPDQFDAADELIHHCVRQIRACQFAPNPAGVEYDDYEMIFNEAITTLPSDDDDDDATEVSQ